MKKSITIELITFEDKKIPSVLESILSNENNKVERINAIKHNNLVIADTVIREAIENLTQHLNSAFEQLQMTLKTQYDYKSGIAYLVLCTDGEFHGNSIRFSVEVGQKKDLELDVWEMDTNVTIKCWSKFVYHNKESFGIEPFIDAETLINKHPETFRELYKIVTKKMTMA